MYRAGVLSGALGSLDHRRLQRHAALRTGRRVHFYDLGVHGTDVFDMRVLPGDRLQRLFGGLRLEILAGVRLKL